MNYKIRWENEKSKYLQIEVTFSNVKGNLQRIHLPAWRPGRYEIQNFAKYVRNVTAETADGQKLAIKKTEKDVWQIRTKGQSDFRVKYEFYAEIKNAGGSYVDDGLLFLNPINCCMYIAELQDFPCTLEVDFKSNNDVACGLSFTKSGTKTVFKSASYHDLVDSPVMISTIIQHKTYEVSGVQFHIWIKGKIAVPWEKVLADFSKFTAEQIKIFGEFPEPSYHFMLWMMPIAYYHGVEHKTSTMMVLGPDSQDFKAIYWDLLGLASHELFHAWNVKRIRPKELIPYDYSRENYFETCFVAEGITTFYGDWILYRSGVMNRAEYQKELETTLRRHFETADNADQSLLESSYDLWLDGYEKSIPDRKVSVYYKGAVASLILHAEIQRITNGVKGLDDIMLSFWQKHGKPFVGYSYKDFQHICEDVTGQKLTAFFKEVIEGKSSVYRQTEKALALFNFGMKKDKNGFIVLENATGQTSES